MDNEVLNQWNAIKETIVNLELDVAKNANGVSAAGIRARKGLRELKRQVSTLVKTTTTLDKQHRAQKAAKKATVAG